MSRIALLASVHIAKKELALDDDAYRAILKRRVDKHSAGDCTDAQLKLLLDEFKRLGWVKRRKLSDKPHIRMIYAIWGDIKPLLDGKTNEKELRSFVARQTRSDRKPDGVSAPEFLDVPEAKKVIEGLKGWRGRLQIAAARAESAKDAAP